MKHEGILSSEFSSDSDLGHDGHQVVPDTMK